MLYDFNHFFHDVVINIFVVFFHFFLLLFSSFFFSDFFIPEPFVNLSFFEVEKLGTVFDDVLFDLNVFDIFESFVELLEVDHLDEVFLFFDFAVSFFVSGEVAF